MMCAAPPPTRRCPPPLELRMNPADKAALLLAATLGAVSTGAAAEPPPCALQKDLQEVRSIKQLPAALARQLGVGVAGIGGIADRGEAFNASDALIGHLPMRRFRLASLGERCALVLLERGGIAHFYELNAYEHLDNGSWQLHPLKPGRGGRIPDSQAELLAQARS
ncbi:MAG: hypothetical protein ABW005_13440 [Burkholderiaceae bacterium]